MKSETWPLEFRYAADAISGMATAIWVLPVKIEAPHLTSIGPALPYSSDKGHLPLGVRKSLVLARPGTLGTIE
jgi:hypothetical protein